MTSINIKQQNSLKTIKFPLVLDGTNIKDGWLQDNQVDLRQKLLVHGAILFKKFLVGNDAVGFYEFAKNGLGVEALPYVGGAAPRNTIYKGNSTSKYIRCSYN
jgi:hypothetical protein